MDRYLRFLNWFLTPLFQRMCLFVLCTLYSVLSTAQSFPVQVVPQALPPAPIYVSNYADASTVSSPLRVQIILNDFEIANREIRLKTYFTGSGLSFQSNDIVVGASPLFLEGGIPLVLTNVELAPYFEFNNITGINANQYGNAIPEGAYQFCVEVYDVLTGSRLSNKSCAVSVVFQNEPPFLVLPRNKENVDEVNPQYIVFQWTPRSINVSNVEYELSLVEIWDNQVDPQQAFLSSPPVFQTTTSATTYVYGPSDPLLLSGKKYAWRVQAKAKQGTEEIGLFKNEGYSEIYSFSYATSCELPAAVNHEVKGSTNANIFWDDFSTDIPEYTVRYRKTSSSGDNEWFESKTTTNLLTLWDLKAGTTYEYQVNKKCTVTESDWSLSKQFTTFIADDEESVYECGIAPDFNLTNQDPLQTIGDKFTAGDFPIKVIEASGSNGRFTGKGYVTIPYLSSIRVGVEFTNVLINTDNQLVEGSVITMYDPSLSNILDIDDAIDTLDDITDAVGEVFEGQNDLDEIRVNWVLDPENDIEIVDGIMIITNPENGATESEPLGDDKVIIDKDGNVYHVDAGGNITEGGQIDPGGEVNAGNVDGVRNNGQIEALTAEEITVNFNTPSTYGFDQMHSSANEKLKKEYTSIKDAKGNDYVLAHHSVKKGGETQIQATINIENNAYTADQVIFKTKQGEVIPKTVSGNSATLTIKGTYTFENETLYAVVPSKEDTSKQLTAGAFTLWHLTEREVKVALVSVNNASLGTIENTVQNIFQKGVAKINFQSSLQLQVDPNSLGDNGLDVGESAWLTAYNDEQKQLVSAVQKLEGYKEDTYYILVFDRNNIKPSRSISGFMPLQRQMGFVFSGNANEEDKGGDMGKVLAHELGHGVFALQHPFGQYDMQQGATNWLMDYNGGTALPYKHWAQIHNPALKFYVFQKEEDGQNTVVSSIPNEFANPDGTYTFLTMNGSYITLPKEAKKLSFITGIDKLNPYGLYPTGALQSFKIGDVKYSASVDGVNFEGVIGIESFNFTYKGFENYTADGRDKYHNAIITIAPDGDGRRLLKTKIENLTFIENEKVNILKPSTYNRLTKATISQNKLKERNYKYGESTPYDPSYNLNQSLVQHFFGENISWNSKYFIVSKLATLNNIYPDIVAEQYRKLKTTTSVPDLKNSIYTSEKAYTVFRKESVSINDIIGIYIDLVNSTKNEFKNCLETLTNITIDTPLNTVVSCIDNLSDNEIKEISVDNKIIALSILTDWGVVTNDATEIEIIRLLKFTKDTDIEDLFDKLKEKSKTQEDEYILKRLVYKIDNDHTWITEDNYLELIKTISTLALKSKKFKDAALAYSDEEFINYNINFYHRSFWDGVFETAALGSSFAYFECNPDTTTDWASDNSINIVIQNRFSCNLTEIPTTDPLEVDPFAPIWFVNKSSLSMLSDYNKTPVLAPSVLAYYANDVGNTRNIIDGIETTIDVASLATGYGALVKGPSALRKAYIIADMLGSGVNLVLSSSSENLSPNAKAVLESLNVLTAIVAVGELGSGVKNLKTLFSKAKLNTKPLPSKDQVNNFLDKLLDDKVSPDEIAEIGVNKIEEAKGWLRQIEAEGKVSNSTDLALKARQARAKLLLIENFISLKNSQVATSIIDLTAGEVSKVKNFLNDSDNYVDVIVHADDAGTGFPVIIELDGVTETVLMTAEELGQALKNIPDTKTIRLLSCNTVEGAKDISKAVGRDIIASNGEMKIYQNGHVEASDWYTSKANGEVDELANLNTGLSPSGEFVTLKKKFVDNLPTNIINDLKNVFGNQYDEFLELVTRSSLPSTWSIEKVGDKLRLVDNKGTVWADFSQGLIRAKGGNTGIGWNKLLNANPPLMKNFKYEVDGNFNFYTDELGRVKEIKVNNIEINPRGRNQEYQSNTKNIKDGYPTDDGGHMVKAEWFGPSEQINYFPQAPSQNQPPGEWFNMEKFVTELRENNPGKTIEFTIYPEFSGSSKRPTGFDVEVKMEGVLINTLPNGNQTYFPNPQN